MPFPPGGPPAHSGSIKSSQQRCMLNNLLIDNSKRSIHCHLPIHTHIQTLVAETHLRRHPPIGMTMYTFKAMTPHSNLGFITLSRTHWVSEQNTDSLMTGQSFYLYLFVCLFQCLCGFTPGTLLLLPPIVQS